ncbi:hypothetical protein K2Z84_00410, partial [Candidatus Binatia bacterium]|nr:hypothetical protein [Candidatus Binatia bacterium]
MVLRLPHGIRHPSEANEDRPTYSVGGRALPRTGLPVATDALRHEAIGTIPIELSRQSSAIQFNRAFPPSGVVARAVRSVRLTPDDGKTLSC